MPPETSQVTAEAPHSDAPIYQDRATGQNFANARDMVNAYLARFSERATMPSVELDETGYAQVRKGSASVGVNVLEDHGVLLILAPVLEIQRVASTQREDLYRKLLELSFLTTADASFALDAQKDEVYARALRRLSGLDYEEFEDLLATVARVADDWDDELRRQYGATTV
jgi:hypothetical protein